MRVALALLSFAFVGACAIPVADYAAFDIECKAESEAGGGDNSAGGDAGGDSSAGGRGGRR